MVNERRSDSVEVACTSAPLEQRIAELTSALPLRLSYEEAARICGSLPVGDFDPRTSRAPFATYSGQVSSVRACHRNLCFVTLRRNGSLSDDIVEVMLKAEFLRGHPIAAPNFVRFSIRPGDYVEVEGWLDMSDKCHARVAIVGHTIRVLVAWPAAWAPGATHFDAAVPCSTHDASLAAEATVFPASRAGATSGRWHVQGNVTENSLQLMFPLTQAAGDTVSSSAEAGGGGTVADWARRVLTWRALVRSDRALGGDAHSNAAPQACGPRIESFLRGIPLHKLCRHSLHNTSGVRGGCRRAACTQLHDEDIATHVDPPGSMPPSRAELQGAWQMWRVADRRAGALRLPGDAKERDSCHSISEDVHGDSSGDVVRAPHAARARTFVNWLAATAPPALLPLASSGRRIIDIAGGAGDIAHQIGERFGSSCTVIDARPPPRMRSVRAPARGAMSAPVAHPPYEHMQAWFDADFVASPVHTALLASASLVVGFHPDQATEAIVDWALASGTPFAVVPCCVYGRLFPQRRLRDGGEVTSYEDLLNYLEQKSPEIRRAFLPYSGRNVVLFSWGGTCAEGSGDH